MLCSVDEDFYLPLRGRGGGSREVWGTAEGSLSGVATPDGKKKKILLDLLVISKGGLCRRNVISKGGVCLRFIIGGQFGRMMFTCSVSLSQYDEERIKYQNVRE